MNINVIMGTAYEKNIISLILLICKNASLEGNKHVSYIFYYDDDIASNKLDNFLSKFKKCNNVSVIPLNSLVGKKMWFSIVTKDELNAAYTGRSYYLLNTVTEQTVTQALLNYYSKVKIQSNINRKKKNGYRNPGVA